MPRPGPRAPRRPLRRPGATVVSCQAPGRGSVSAGPIQPREGRLVASLAAVHTCARAREAKRCFPTPLALPPAAPHRHLIWLPHPSIPHPDPWILDPGLLQVLPQPPHDRPSVWPRQPSIHSSSVHQCVGAECILCLRAPECLLASSAVLYPYCEMTGRARRPMVAPPLPPSSRPALV